MEPLEVAELAGVVDSEVIADRPDDDVRHTVVGDDRLDLVAVERDRDVRLERRRALTKWSSEPCRLSSIPGRPRR